MVVYGQIISLLHSILLMPADTVTGGLADQPGAIAGIVIAAVVFALLNLITFAVIFHYVHSQSKKGKSTSIVYQNNYTNDGDLQTEYHQLERSHSYEQPIDPKDSTHPNNQSMTMSQGSDRQRFLKRAVRRPFVQLKDSIITILQHQEMTLAA